MRRQWLGVVLMFACGWLAAQQPPPGLPVPTIIQVYPMGVSTLSPPQVHVLGMDLSLPSLVKVTGTDLDEPYDLLFSHPGLKATYVDNGPVEINLKGKGKAKKNATVHTFRVTAAPNVPPGIYDVWVASEWGLSNPRAFAVGRFPEFVEREPNNDVPEAQRVPLDVTINGIFAAGNDVDYYVVAARKGQRILLSCLATSIDSRAIPLIEVFDSSGRRLADNRNYREDDALTDVIIPTDGDYYIRLSQFTYQGGGVDHFYRLTVATAPWIDAVLPPVVEAGKPTPVTLYGRNLPNGQPADGYTIDGRPLEKLSVTIQPPADPLARQRWDYAGYIRPQTALLDGFSYVFAGPNGQSFPVPVFLTDVPVVTRQPGTGAAPERAQAVPVPGEVCGFIAQRGEVVWHRFEAKKGQQLVVELFAERLGVPADFYFSIRTGKDPNRDLVGEQDDNNDTLHPINFFTRSLDPPPVRFTAPEDGFYYVRVGCRQSSLTYGPRLMYRLRITPPQPDFRVVAMPYSRHYQTGSAAWQGGQQSYDVFVDRRHDYNGEITISAEGLPPGVTALPLTIGPESRWGVLVLKVAADAPAFSGFIRLKAVGTPPMPGGQPLVREVRSATIVWGFTQEANAPVIARLSSALPLAVRPFKAHFVLIPDTGQLKINDKTAPVKGALRVKPKDVFALPLHVQWLSGDKQNLKLAAELTQPSNNKEPIKLQFLSQPTKEKPEAVIKGEVRPDTSPGTYTLIIKGTAQIPFTHPTTKKGSNVAIDVHSEPILVTVLPVALAKMTVTSLPNNQLLAGTTGEIVVQVNRLHGYYGPFQLAVELPPNTAGLKVQADNIPAGHNEGKIRLIAAPDAKAGPINGIVVVAIAPYDPQYTVRHETKFNLTVVQKKK
jgi:hypothetical protein